MHDTFSVKILQSTVPKRKKEFKEIKRRKVSDRHGVERGSMNWRITGKMGGKK